MHAIEARTIAKVSKRLMPFLLVCYFVAIAAAHDGAGLISEDGNGTIWRITL